MENKLTQRLEILKSAFTIFTDKQCKLTTEINEKLYMQLKAQEQQMDALTKQVEILTSVIQEKAWWNERFRKRQCYNVVPSTCNLIN